MYSSCFLTNYGMHGTTKFGSEGRYGARYCFAKECHSIQALEILFSCAWNNYDICIHQRGIRGDPELFDSSVTLFCIRLCNDPFYDFCRRLFNRKKQVVSGNINCNDDLFHLPCGCHTHDSFALFSDYDFGFHWTTKVLDGSNNIDTS